MTDMRIIETDTFPFEFLSRLAEHESWRKEIHRPIYHVHKWWAKRLGSVFRGILLGAIRSPESDLATDFYSFHDFCGLTLFDPFMGSGTSIGEAHKLGLTSLGRDINPVAVNCVQTALGPLNRSTLLSAFEDLSHRVGREIQAIYRSKDHRGRLCDVLYFFWVMQVPCPSCEASVDLFTSRIVARNAYPDRRPEVQVLCPTCGQIFPSTSDREWVNCARCRSGFDPRHGNAVGSKAICSHCQTKFGILNAVARLGTRPTFRLYGKLVLTADGDKQYLPSDAEDDAAYRQAGEQLQQEIRNASLVLPNLELVDGCNTRQAMNYNFRTWRDFFNDRQLLALAHLRRGITELEDPAARNAFLTLFSGTLEFNNLFTSYKGEGTGAVRHMFSHHILKPERVPIEANVWGTKKSSGSFSTLFRTRLLRAIDYRKAPTEISRHSGRQICSHPFTGKLEDRWPVDGLYGDRAIFLSRGDSAESGLRDRSVDLVITDPPFFDNVHYSELADFFYAWQQLDPEESGMPETTRDSREVQDANQANFARKLQRVFQECERVLKDDGLLIFTYHHSRDEGWTAVACAILGAGFVVVNSHPVKAEMSVATPKSQAKEPIQLDTILVCRKTARTERPASTREKAMEAARNKIERLHRAGFRLSLNDQKVVLFGQLLTTLRSPVESAQFVEVGDSFEKIEDSTQKIGNAQLELFDAAIAVDRVDRGMRGGEVLKPVVAAPHE